MNHKTAGLMSFAAVLLFLAAVLQFINGMFISGALFCAAGACFAYAAGLYRKKQQ